MGTEKSIYKIILCKLRNRNKLVFVKIIECYSMKYIPITKLIFALRHTVEETKNYRSAF